MNIDMSPMMTAVLLFAVSALSAMGWGALVARLLRLAPNNGERGLLGLLSLGVAAMVIHFFIPLSAAVRIVLLVVGLVALVVRRFDAGWAGAGLVGVASLSVLTHDNIVTVFDNGFYHMQTFLWNSNVPITPGVANVHQRLGFNSLVFVIAPIVDRVEIGWLVNGLTATFVLAAMLERLRAEGRSLAAGAFWFLVCAVAIFAWSPTWLAWLGVLRADGVTAALGVYCVYLWLEYLFGVRKDTVPGLLVLISTLQILVKLSALPFVLAGAGVWLLRREIRPSRRVLAVVAAAMVVWMARGTLLSGCLVYPLPQTCVYDLPWAVSAQWPRSESLSVRSWARSPGRIDYEAVLSNWDWLGPWYATAREDELIRALRRTVPLGIAGLLLAFLARRRIEPPVLYVAAFVVGCVGWWFWAAPDPRFGAGAIASLSIVSLGLALWWVPLKPLVRRVTVYLLVASVVVLAIRDATQRDLRWAPSIPPAPVKVVPGPNGVAIRITTGGSQQCWDQPIPCAPAFHEDQQAFAKVRWPHLPSTPQPAQPR